MKELRIKFEGSGEIVVQKHNYGSGDKLYIGEEDKEIIIVPCGLEFDRFIDFLWNTLDLEVTP